MPLQIRALNEFSIATRATAVCVDVNSMMVQISQRVEDMMTLAACKLRVEIVFRGNSIQCVLFPKAIVLHPRSYGAHLDPRVYLMHMLCSDSESLRVRESQFVGKASFVADVELKLSELVRFHHPLNRIINFEWSTNGLWPNLLCLILLLF